MVKASFPTVLVVLISEIRRLEESLGIFTRVAPDKEVSLPLFVSELPPELRIEVSGIIPSVVLLRSSSFKLIARREMKMLEKTVHNIPPFDLYVVYMHQ